MSSCINDLIWPYDPRQKQVFVTAVLWACFPSFPASSLRSILSSPSSISVPKALPHSIHVSLVLLLPGQQLEDQDTLSTHTMCSFRRTEAQNVFSPSKVSQAPVPSKYLQHSNSQPCWFCWGWKTEPSAWITSWNQPHCDNSVWAQLCTHTWQEGGSGPKHLLKTRDAQAQPEGAPATWNCKSCWKGM